MASKAAQVGQARENMAYVTMATPFVMPCWGGASGVDGALCGTRTEQGSKGFVSLPGVQ